jgi:glycosyltransferase involved in cell wall biosynthesis
VDEQIGWMPFAASAGRKMIESNHISVIYSTSSPYTSHLVAGKLHYQTHIPWVADFRDPWVDNPFITFPTTFHHRLNENLERSIFNDADRVILNTQRSLHHYQQKYSSLAQDKFLTIPNGYDQADQFLPRTDFKRNDRFTFVHLGSLYQNSRSADYFLKALHQAFQSGKLPQGKVLVKFVGAVNKETLDLLRRYSLTEQVELLGYLPHRDALVHANTCDLLLLIPYYGRGSELFVPAKVYEYLASKIPILYLADTGECADLIRKARSGWLVPSSDINQIADVLVKLYGLWETGDLTIRPDMEIISSFERHKLTRQLAGLFNEVSS